MSEHELPGEARWGRLLDDARTAGGHARVHEILLETDVAYHTGYQRGRLDAERRCAELERERDEARAEAKGLLSRLRQFGAATGLVLSWNRRRTAAKDTP